MRKSIGIVLALSFAAAPAFAGKGSSQAGLAAAVASGSEDSIVGEIEQAEYLPSTGAIAIVLPLIDHPSARVRDAAGWWLTRRDVRAQVISTCTARLGGQDPVGARNCADVLGGMRDFGTIGVLARFLGAPLDEDSGAAAARALGAIGHPNGLPALTSALGSPLAGVRNQALQSMRNLRALPGQKVAAPTAPVLPLLSDADAGVRRQAALTIGFLGGNGGDIGGAAQALSTAAASDASAPVRKAAVWALGQIKDPAGRAALVRAQGDSDPFVRSIASAALASLH